MKRTIFIQLLTVVFLSSVSMGVQAQEFNPNKGQQQDIEVSDSELEKFVEVSKALQQEQKSSQSVMIQAIKENELGMKRFQEITRAQRQGNEVDMTEREKKAYQAVKEVMKKEQQKMRKKMRTILKDHAMDRRRYVQISRALQNDQELQQRLKAMQDQ